MVKFQKILIALAVGTLFVIGLFLGAVLTRWVVLPGRMRTYDTPALLRQVTVLSELVTIQYVMEKVVIVEAPPETMLGQMFAGDNRILLVAHGVVKAGIDVRRMKPDDIRIDGKKLRIRLPAAQITDAYLDDKQTRIIERKTGFLRAFDKDLEQNVRQNAVDDIRRAARQNGIQKDAEERARLQIQNLFLQLGFERVEFD